VIDLKSIISPKDYKTFAGPDWPSYQEIVQGQPAKSAPIQTEVDEFVQMMKQTYQELTQSGSALAQQNQQRQQQVFYDKQMSTSPGCRIPWNTMGVNSNGDVFICSSPSWIPLFVGNLLAVDDVYNVLNSDVAQSIRQEILQGRYYYCNNQICSFFSNIDPGTYQRTPLINHAPHPLNSKPELLVNQIPTNLIFDFDYTCNFRCPSCRTQLINNNKHHVIRPINDRIVEKIKHQVIDRIENQLVSIRWCGGEPFISDVYNNLLNYIIDSGKTNIKHIIQTNGSYLQAKADMLMRLLPTVTELRVSFDAATAETYNKTRVGGDWDLLIHNVKWLQQHLMSNSSTTRLSADYVIQIDNYKEIPEFVKLCETLGIQHINFQKMWNWGTWPQQEFDDKNIYNPKHPLYNDLKDTFKKAGRKILF